MMILFEDKGWTINKLNRADHPQPVKEQRRISFHFPRHIEKIFLNKEPDALDLIKMI